jgi:hypothetical protein
MYTNCLALSSMMCMCILSMLNIVGPMNIPIISINASGSGSAMNHSATGNNMSREAHTHSDYHNEDTLISTKYTQAIIKLAVHSTDPTSGARRYSYMLSTTAGDFSVHMEGKLLTVNSTQHTRYDSEVGVANNKHRVAYCSSMHMHRLI